METSLEKARRTIINRLLEFSEIDQPLLERIKSDVSRELGLDSIPSNSELLKSLKKAESEKLSNLLTRKQSRITSGVTVIAAMTKPRACPHGKCLYCPGGPDQNVPQSYTGHEPASMRGAQNRYDPFKQVKSRIKQLEAIGHPVDKVELIVMGGTFLTFSKRYENWFIKRCLDALNEARSASLEEAKKLAYSANIRNVGLTIETRPDELDERKVDHLLNLGVTRVELGVQNVYDDIYKIINREHTVRDVIYSNKILRDAGLKVCFHMMPGLPGSSVDRDLEGFRTIFSDPLFKPDMLKIYPTLVLKGTELYQWWKRGEYTPLTTEEAVELITRVKMMVPPWIRIMRVQRDIPAKLIEAGVKKSNLRELVFKRLGELGKGCKCIRCREVGHKSNQKEIKEEELEMKRIVYEASGGIENFISVEDHARSTLIGFIRMRVPSEEAHRPELQSKTAIVRELHIYGRMVPVGRRSLDAWQHKGWGRILLSEVEKLAREEYDLNKVSILSALGTRQYYRRLGYYEDGAYMSKLFSRRV
ncbi:MAG: tRNA uridine(34) 5-carboxymethylaminomethyl modification radical SAM/GNAT enzyme Elp3 [Candidatus Bathyarchaeia archaeon]